MINPWEHDRLGYKAIGETFTNLIKSIDSAKVISIEAGFGRGKTFFRKAWSEHLRQVGEIVIEIDVQQSDHSGDPVVTLLGALVDAIPKEDGDKIREALDSAKKLGAMGARTVARIALRSGADELINAATESAMDKVEGFHDLDKIINDIGDGMSKAAGQFIAAQMAAEKVRKEELPQQLKTLRTALTQNSKNDRVIIVIDELDRCHPDHAIAVLEAMKLVFNQSGFVFCLMVNVDYLEKLAQHRFGVSTNDEKYLDKFVDIRLGLTPKEDAFKSAVYELALELPLKNSYGESESFSVGHAAELASVIAVQCGLSMRKVKRILLKVEIALRCYADRPLDASLLVYMAFQDEFGSKVASNSLRRSFFTPEIGAKKMKAYNRIVGAQKKKDFEHTLNKFIGDNGPELLELPKDRYKLPDERDYYNYVKVFEYLARHYVPSHQNVLNAVEALIVPAD